MECLDSGITCQVIRILRGWRMRTLLLQSLIPALLEEFYSEHCCHCPVLSSAPHWNLGSDSRRWICYRNQHCCHSLGQSLMQLSAFQANLGVLLLLTPSLIIFKNKVAFLNENHVTKLLLMALGSKPRVLFQVSPSAQETGGRWKGSCVWWLCKFMTPKCIYLMGMCLLNNERLPNGVLWVIGLQILALIRKWESGKGLNPRCDVISVSSSHTILFPYIHQKSSVWQITTEMQNSGSIFGKCTGFSLERNTLSTDFCQFTEPENNSAL